MSSRLLTVSPPQARDTYYHTIARGSRRASQRKLTAHVRVGSAGVVGIAVHQVRFRSSTGSSSHSSRLQLRAISGHNESYSITSSARVRSTGGSVKPSAFAALRLTISLERGGLIYRDVARFGSGE